VDIVRQRLAPREMEIATLVAQGLSNRQIADRLSLSVRTVEHVLYGAYCKLRGKNRTTLALLVTLAKEPRAFGRE